MVEDGKWKIGDEKYKLENRMWRVEVRNQNFPIKSCYL